MMPAKPLLMPMLLSNLAMLSAMASAQPTETTAQHQQTVERLTISGRRNMPQTEVNEDTQKLLNIGGLMGDPIQALYTLPGVVYDTTDSAPAVRGSSPRDNHFMLDGQRTGPLLNQLYGSALNSELLRDFTLYPAAFAAPFGHATGAVFDVALRDPKAQPLGGVIDLNMLRTSALVEGSLSENQSVYAAYRHSTLQYFTEKGEELEDGETITKLPVLNDYQLRYQWRPGDQHKLTLTALGVGEKAGINLSEASEAGRIDPDFIGDAYLNSNWHSQQLRYEYFGQQQQLLAISLLQLNQREQGGFGDNQFYQLNQNNTELQIRWQQPLSSTVLLQTGAEAGRLNADYRYDMILYYCTDHQPDCEANRGEREQDDDRLSMQYQTLYISADWQLTPDLLWQFGSRYDHQDYTGDSLFAPRTHISWFVTNKLELVASAGRHQQLADIEKSLPKIGNRNLQSPRSDHYTAGLRYQFDSWRLLLDFYYKNMQRLPRALNPAEDPEQLHYVSDVTGYSRGVELMLEKELPGNWSGWLAMSFSQSERKDPVTGENTPYRLDTPLVIHGVLNYKLSNDWTLGAVFTGRSGNLYSPITGAKPNPYHPDYLLPVYGELNSKRLPFYHRLDVELRKQSTLFGRPAEYTIAVRNLYNRRNISGYYLLNQPEQQSYNINKDEDMGLFPYVGMKLWF
ncbi:MAG: hypothetical protein CVV11_15155 [Gammaproteobacteria bacterium HGW-Gammaproteobacteria-15]|nr:MAG: hypothetical protein CVV11_15155 [Gammaproteobacteria bacterium HGW-Gammaproteobacteria-15]